MNTFWKRRRDPKREAGTQESPREDAAAEQGEASTASGSESGDRNEIPRYAKDLKALLRVKLGLEDRPQTEAQEYPSREENWNAAQRLQDLYLAMRARDRQKIEQKFAAFFSQHDDIRVDVSPLLERLRRERRVCESETVTDSLYLVELLERRLANGNLTIPKDAGQPAIVTAGEVRAMLAAIFELKRRGVRDLAAHLDTIHRVTPSLCECLHAALISRPGAPRKPEEWEEFFLEPDRLAAEEAAGGNLESEMYSVDYEYQEVFSLERALLVDRATEPSGVLKAMLDWPSSKRHSEVRTHLAYFFAAFRRLPASEQRSALPHLRDAVFQELVPEDPNLPLRDQEPTAGRWFARILGLGEEHLALLFGEQSAKSVLELAERGRDESYEANRREGIRSRDDERLNSLEEQMGYLFSADRFDWKAEFDAGVAHDHLLDLMLNAQERATVYVFQEGSYPVCSKYCDLLWDRAVSAILLEQKITIVESAYEQWRCLELMRKLSIIRLRGQHPGYHLGWRW